MLPIEILEQKPFYLGSWLVNPAKNKIQNKEVTKTVQPKLMEVLTYLCSKQNKIVNSEELIKQCWPHQYISDNPIHKCIAQLRKALGDSPKNPKFIATIPKRGYSIIAHVSSIQNQNNAIEPFWLDQPPFRGLDQYKSEHKEIFFGRSQAMIDILSLIDNKDSASSNLIMLLGQSGCGKSSLVQAGLIPKLIHPYKPFKNKYITSFTYIPSNTKENQLTQSFLAFLYENKVLSQEKSMDDYIEILSSNTELTNFIQPHDLKNDDTKNAIGRVIIFIDQLEFVFTNNTSRIIIDQFFKVIEYLLLSKTCLLITALRNEYYQELTDTHNYIKVRSHAYHYDVPPLNYDEISDIVRKPVQAAGLKYEIDPKTHVPLDTYLINKAQSVQASLPILQYTLWNLYQNKKSNTLSYEVYRSNGGMEGGLSIMAEKAYQELSPPCQEQFNGLLHNFIQIDPEAKDSARCKKASMKLFTDNYSKIIIEKFTDKRLFQTEWIDDQPFVRISHDILLKNWPRLDQWIKENISLLNSQHELKVATDRWLHHSKSKDFLLNAEQPIRSANLIAHNSQIALSNNEQAFIKASNTRFNLTKRLKHTLVASLAISLFLSVFLAFSIYRQNKQVTETKNNAEHLISFILFDLKDKLTPLGRIDLLDLVGTKTLDYFASIGTDNLSETSLLHWIEALHIAGEVSFTKGNYAQSQQYFNKSHKIILAALERNDLNNAFLEKDMLNSYWLGYINVIEKKHQAAEKDFQKYLQAAITLAQKEPDQQKWQLERSYALNNLGTLAVNTEQLTRANDYFLESVEIKKALLAKDPENQLLIADLADSVSWLGKIKKQQGHLKAQLTINQESLKLSRELVSINPDQPQWLHRLSIALHRVALIHYDFNDLPMSKTMISESVQLMEALVENDKENYSYKKQLINNYILMSKIHRHQKDFDQSLFYIQRGQSLVNLFKTQLKFDDKLAAYHINLIVEQAKIMAQLEQHQVAIESLDNAMTIWQKHLKNNKPGQPKDEHTQQKQALIQLAKVDVLDKMERDSKAIQEKLLKSIQLTLLPFVNETSRNYQTIAMYLRAQEYSNQTGLKEQKLHLVLQESKYQNPDHQPLSRFNQIETTLSHNQ